jgi:uncharacterized protein (DUF1499 family)
MVRLHPLLPLLSLLFLGACAPTSHLLTTPDGLTSFEPCGTAPRCAVSLADPGPGGDSVAPLVGGADATEALANLRAVLDDTPGYRVILDDGHYLHAEFTTPRVRYRDDVEFLVRGDGRIDVRSSARIGWYDRETNRRRVERLQSALDARRQ